MPRARSNKRAIFKDRMNLSLPQSMRCSIVSILPTVPETYLPGHHPSVVANHARRTAETAAGFFLPFLNPGMRLLDVGCGPGSITSGLARRAEPAETIGIDPCPSVIEIARSLPSAHAAKRLRFEVGNIYEPRFEAATFDAVFAHQLLQHLHRPVEALRQMRVLLAPGGVLGVREVDWDSATFYPESKGILRFLRLYYSLTCRDGGEPNAGRYLPRWVREAGFVDIRVSTSTVSYTEPAATRAWADAYADTLLQSKAAEKILEYGLATRSDLGGIASAWQSWSRDVDAFFCFSQTEVVAWKR
jgi:ubiquinone/menaquinone biosynthesis C-methylase UbiE